MDADTYNELFVLSLTTVTRHGKPFPLPNPDLDCLMFQDEILCIQFFLRKENRQFSALTVELRWKGRKLVATAHEHAGYNVFSMMAPDSDAVRMTKLQFPDWEPNDYVPGDWTEYLWRLSHSPDAEHPLTRAEIEAEQQRREAEQQRKQERYAQRRQALSAKITLKSGDLVRLRFDQSVIIGKRILKAGTLGEILRTHEYHGYIVTFGGWGVPVRYLNDDDVELDV